MSAAEVVCLQKLIPFISCFDSHFLMHFSKRVLLVEQALDLLFDKKGQMDQNRFVSLLVAGSHASADRKRKGSALAWGMDSKLWGMAVRILNQKVNASKPRQRISRKLDDRLLHRDVKKGCKEYSRCK